MSKVITVDELAKMAAEMKKKGYGKKKILLSGDDEGNTYHPLFFGFTTEMKGEDISYGLPWGVSEEDFDKNYIILG